MENNVTSLEQSKWLKEFFERNLSVEPLKSNFYHTTEENKKYIIFKPTPKYSDILNITNGEAYNFYELDFVNLIPAYLLEDLEKVLPDRIYEGNDCYIKLIHYCNKWKAKEWRYFDGTKDTVCVARNLITDNSFQNIIELLKVLEGKGVFKSNDRKNNNRRG